MKKLISLFSNSAVAVDATQTEIQPFKPSSLIDIKQNEGYELFNQTVTSAILPSYLNSQALKELNSLINVNEQKILTLRKEHTYTLLPQQEVMYKEAVLDNDGYFKQVSDLTYKPEKFGGVSNSNWNFKMREFIDKGADKSNSMI